MDITTTIDDDVMNAVFSHCPVSSLLSLSLVSSHTHTLALPHLLHSVRLDHLGQQELVVSFLQYILDDTGSQRTNQRQRGQFVQHLEISWLIFRCPTLTDDGNWNPWDEEEENSKLADLGRMFTQALQLMPNFLPTVFGIKFLVELELGGIREGASEALGYASNAISSQNLLPNLRKLHLKGVTSDADLTSPYPNVIRNIPPLLLTPQKGAGLFVHRLKGQLSSICLDEFDLRGFLGSCLTQSGSIREMNVRECILDSTRDLGATSSGLHTLVVDAGTASSIREFRSEHTQLPILFPHLKALNADYTLTRDLIRSNTIDPKRLQHLYMYYGTCREHDMRFWELDCTPSCHPFPVLKEMTQLKGLSFSYAPFVGEQVGLWWTRFANSVNSPDLKYLDVSFGNPSGVSTDQLRILCELIPSMLAHVSLEYISLDIWRKGEIETVQKAVGCAWAVKIPSLKYIDVRERPYTSTTLSDDDQHWMKVEGRGFRESSVTIHRVGTGEGLEKKRVYAGPFYRW